MRTIMLLTMTAALGAGCSEEASATTGPTSIPAVRTIVALGDSLTSGHGLAADEAYPAALDEMLEGARLPFIVLNHGVSGDTTAAGVRRLAAALDERPAILILALGANDGVRGVPVAQVRSNLEAIIQAAQAQDVAVLLCGMEAFPIHGFEYSLEFHRLFPALAAKYGILLVPFMLEGVMGNRAMLQPDMVHPNAAGAARIARIIWPHLQPLAIAATESVRP